ncbi:MAG: L-type lectin-domain containing protein [Planctomycetota bacterium]
MRVQSLRTSGSWGAVLACVIGFGGLASADTISFADFSDVSSLTLNGAAAQAGAVLRLTPDAGSLAGSAFVTAGVPVGATSSIHSSFVYRIHGIRGGGPLGSDGMAFVIQADPRGATALGTAGGALGYGGPTLITPSVIVEFDTHINFGVDPGDNHVALHKDGDWTVDLTHGFPGFTLNDGTSQYVWVDYNGLTDLFEVFVSKTATKPGAALFSHTIDLSAVLGSDTAYFGFTAGTGGGFNAHDIESWSVKVIPEPATLLLVTAGVACVAVRRRRRRA